MNAPHPSCGQRRRIRAGAASPSRAAASQGGRLKTTVSASKRRTLIGLDAVIRPPPADTQRRARCEKRTDRRDAAPPRPTPRPACRCRRAHGPRRGAAYPGRPRRRARWRGRRSPARQSAVARRRTGAAASDARPRWRRAAAGHPAPAEADPWTLPPPLQATPPGEPDRPGFCGGHGTPRTARSHRRSAVLSCQRQNGSAAGPKAASRSACQRAGSVQRVTCRAVGQMDAAWLRWPARRAR